MTKRWSSKVSDGQQPMGAPAQGDMDAFKPDMLPLDEEQNGHQGRCNRNILVAVSGHELDRELVTLAGKVAREKKAAVRPQIFAVYGIEVPRTKAIDDEMPEETDRAHQALNHAAGVAPPMGNENGPEIRQPRH